MKKSVKRIISLLLAIILCAGLLSAGVWAEEENPEPPDPEPTVAETAESPDPEPTPEPIDTPEPTLEIPSGACGESLTWKLEGGVLTISGAGAIPDFAFGNAPWYEHCGDIKSVVLNSGVTAIGEHAFSACPSLTSIAVDEGSASFRSVDGVLYDKALQTLICYPMGKAGSRFAIPDGVTTIGDRAFYECTGLTSISLPDSVTYIGGSAFRRCDSLTSITLPAGVTAIGYYVFEGCSSLTSVTLPDSVTSIGNKAFLGCGSLTSITLPAGVTYVGGDAFGHCYGLKSVTFEGDAPSLYVPDGNRPTSPFTGDTVTVYYYKDAAGWTDAYKETMSQGEDPNVPVLTWIALDRPASEPEETASGTCGENLTWKLVGGVLTISGTGAMPDYYTNAALPWMVWLHKGEIRSVVIGSGVTYIGNAAFDVCRSLTSVTLSDSVTAIGANAFARTGLTSITLPDSVTTIGEYAFGSSDLTDITLPGSVTTIGRRAFSGCVGLTSVTLPAGVTAIGAGAFNGCTGLTSITVDEGNASFRSVDGVLYDKALKTLICYPGGKGERYFTIPNGVTAIGREAFWKCTSLTGLTIPGGVTAIGREAFWECTGLTGVTIPTGASVGDRAFWGCTGLTSVTISAGVWRIDMEAFWGCTGLTSVTIPASVTELGLSAFGFCDSLESVTFEGNAPSFCVPEDYPSDHSREYSPFSGDTVTLYYYKDAAGWTDAYKEAMTQDTAPPTITWIALDRPAAPTATPAPSGAASDDETVTVTNEDGSAWDDAIKLVVEKIKENVLSAAEIIKLGIKRHIAFDITLVKAEGGVSVDVQPDGQVRVTIAVPVGYIGSRCRVYHMAEDGALTDMDAVYKNGKLSFITDHFSTYIVAEAEAAPAPTATPAAEPTAAPTPRPDTPKTGDGASIALWAALMALCAGGLCLLAARKKEH